MSTKTKKLSAGVPIVDSSGAVTAVTIAELARQIGKELGVQQAAYRVEGVKWIRIARVDSNGGIIILKNMYANSLSKGVVIAFTGAYNHLNCDAKIISGTPIIFDGLRFVANSGVTYLEIHSSQSLQNPWMINLYSGTDGQVNGIKSSGCELYQSLTEGEITQGYAAKELTLADLQWGGVNAALSGVYASLLACLAKKGGQRHEREDKEGIGIATGRRARLAARSDRRGNNGTHSMQELFGRRPDTKSGFGSAFDPRRLLRRKSHGKCKGRSYYRNMEILNSGSHQGLRDNTTNNERFGVEYGYKGHIRIQAWNLENIPVMGKEAVAA